MPHDKSRTVRPESRDVSQPLSDLLSRAAQVYKRALIGHQRGLTWDYVVLTAANEHQAAGYRHELAMRSSGAGPLGAFFPSSQRSIVVPDPPGFRAGSGGATFGVLRAIAQHQKLIGDKQPFDTLRILLIHSGGASQRLPLYSPLGKIFTPLPLVRPDGQLMTLFDHLYLMMAGLPARLGPGLLVSAGDVFLLFDALAMPKPPAGVTALSIRTDAAMGEHHGVFKTADRPLPVAPVKMKKSARKSVEHSIASSASTVFPLVQSTMQKASVEQMRSAGVTDSQDRVLIDSGLVFFDAASTEALYDLSKKYNPAWHLRTRHQIDLYSDIVPAALSQDAPPLLTSDPALRKLQTDLRAALRPSPLHVYELPSAHFQHLGTTRQFRDAMTGIDQSPACRLFHQNVRFASATKIPSSARVYQSVISAAQVELGPDTVIENCLIERPVRIGAGSILSNLSLATMPTAKTSRKTRQPTKTATHPTTRTLTIPPEILLFGVPLREDQDRYHVTVILGIHDDPKTDRTFCNIDFRHWLTLAGLTADDLWEASESKRVLWNAQLFPAEPAGSGNDGTDHLSWFTAPATITANERIAWRKARRYSMAQILESADASAMAAHRDTLSGMLQATEWIRAIESHTAASVQNTVNHFGAQGYQRLTDQLLTAATDEVRAPLRRARLAWSLAEITSRPLFPREEVKVALSPPQLQKKAFDAIRQAMDSGAETLHRRSRSAATGVTRVQNHAPLIASAPVRLDFAGGWTDTPPYCLESGGAVVNIAINLNDVEPIQSTFRPLEEPIVRLISQDLGKTLIVNDPSRLLKSIEPGDPFALHRAAITLTGFAPQPGETSQKKWLTRVMGGDRRWRGFELSTASNLPKGSGMGTSSILGATALAVLRRAAGQDIRHASLFEQTLLLEQHLGTGGGWQDQVGGILGGAKITETSPGIPQSLKVRPIPLSSHQVRALEDRLVVYFTGQQRLARNILREVMGRYLSREPGTMVLFNELTQSSQACEIALRKSDWLSLATEINRYWRIKKELFPGSTTPAVDALFLELRPYYLGGCLAGAGGGGFAYFLCADPDQAHRLRTELATLSMRPGSLGLAFAATLNATGLRVAAM